MANEIYHYGILGMKWGRRRFQNSDGSLTTEGKKQYGRDNPTVKKKKKSDGSLTADEKKKRRLKKIEKINQTATKIELATLGAGAVIFGLAAMSPSDSAYRQAVNKGMVFVFGNKQILKSQVKDFTANHLDPRNITITDADGNILKKYRNKVSVRNVYNELPSGG